MIIYQYLPGRKKALAKFVVYFITKYIPEKSELQLPMNEKSRYSVSRPIVTILSPSVKGKL